MKILECSTVNRTITGHTVIFQCNHPKFEISVGLVNPVKAGFDPPPPLTIVAEIPEDGKQIRLLPAEDFLELIKYQNPTKT